MAMVKHSIDVVRKAVQHLNAEQTPVVTFDRQPLYAIFKQIQWKWPEMYGEDKFVVMFGGLHIEMAALRTLGDWLQGNGWVETLVQAEITTADTANSQMLSENVMLAISRFRRPTGYSRPIDQAHEQNNACNKSDGGVVGLTDNPSALRRWMVVGPEVAALIEDFEDAHQLMGRRDEVLHGQAASVQNAFRKDVCSFVNVMEELGNTFEDESEHLHILHSKDIADPSAVKTVKKAQKISQQQFQAFTKQCFVEGLMTQSTTIG